MARLFGVTEQRYNNWIYRDSLPKAFYEKAKELVGEGSIHFDQMREIMAMLSEPEQEKLVAQAPLSLRSFFVSHIQR